MLPSVRTRPAFTLIELLVVISIIALLIAILLPALGAARSSARTVACQSQIRQVVLAGLIYADEYDERMLCEATPLDLYWTRSIRPYINAPDHNADPTPELLQCPEMNFPGAMNTDWWDSSYGLNWMIGKSVIASWPGYPKRYEIYQPSKVVYFADARFDARLVSAYEVNTVPTVIPQQTFVHGANRDATAGYVDGHVGLLNPDTWNGPSVVTTSPSQIEQPWDPWGPGKFGNP